MLADSVWYVCWQDVLQVLTLLVQATHSRGPGPARLALQGRVGSVVRLALQQLAAPSGQATKTKSAVLHLLKALVPLREVPRPTRTLSPTHSACIHNVWMCACM